MDYYLVLADFLPSTTKEWFEAAVYIFAFGWFASFLCRVDRLEKDNKTLSKRCTELELTVQRLQLTPQEREVQDARMREIEERVKKEFEPEVKFTYPHMLGESTDEDKVALKSALDELAKERLKDDPKKKEV